MLAISFKVGHNIAINNMFHDFTTNRGQGHRSVIRGVLFVTFLEYWTYNGFPPICWYNTLIGVKRQRTGVEGKERLHQLVV